MHAISSSSCWHGLLHGGARRGDNPAVLVHATHRRACDAVGSRDAVVAIALLHAAQLRALVRSELYRRHAAPDGSCLQHLAPQLLRELLALRCCLASLRT